MIVSFDTGKRSRTLEERGLDFAVDAARVFAGLHVDFEARGRDYGETRMITAGWLGGRMLIIVWTQRGRARHVISMRYCHAKEARKILREFPEIALD